MAQERHHQQLALNTAPDLAERRAVDLLDSDDNPAQVVFPDRLQVRMSTNGASTDVGTTATSVGDFTNLLLDINPTYLPEGYPRVWTQFTVTLSGIPGGSTLGRLAFRYFVENGGPNGVNSDYIGIDTVVYRWMSTPTPTT